MVMRGSFATLSIGEQLCKKYAEGPGYDVLRIKEKPEGGNNAKADEARGDFYIRKKGENNDMWYVVECKSAKSNAEERAFIGKQDKEMSKRRAARSKGQSSCRCLS